MSAGRCNFHASLNGFLSLYIGKIMFRKLQIFIEFFPCIYQGLFQRNILIKKINDLFNIFNPKHLNIIYNSRFLSILNRKNKPLKPFFPCLNGYGQGSFYRLKVTVQRQFAHNEEVSKIFSFYLIGSGQNPHSQGQVVGTAFLAHISR